MLKLLRSMRSLQRRFAVLIFASVLVFLVYLLVSNSGHLQSARSIQEQHHSFIPPPAALQQGVVLQVNRDRHHDDGALRQRAADSNVDLTVSRVTAPKTLPSTVSKVTASALVTDVRDVRARQDMEREIGNKPESVIENIAHREQWTVRALPPVNGPLTVREKTTPPPLATDLTDPYSGPRNKEQQEIVGAFLHAWNFYKKYAWGHDELKPISKGWQEWMGIGLTIVDSLDTMYIMGLKNEFAEARDWVATKLSFERDHEVQLFEIVIRELGGLLSAYHLSGDKIFLDKARDLGNKLYPCLSGPTNIPCNRINLRRARPHFLEISTAEVGTIQLEFRDLTRSASDEKFEKAVEAISEHLHNMKKLDGLVACYINPHTGEFRPSSTVSVGASADSYYEYLIKQWIQTGKKNDVLKNDYLEAVAGIEKHLYRHTQYSHLGFVGAYYNMNSRSFRRDMEHLACFLPGMLALGYQAGLRYENHLKMAENITNTCYQMYARMPTGLSPEVATMNMNNNDKEDFFVMTSSAFNLQRPETVESIFYMYRVTKDAKYRQWGWKIFQAFEQYTRLPDGGYASISNVKNAKDPVYRDKMETFYLAETLKYLYLLFSDDPYLIPLDKFVINTEAHPLPIYDS